MPQIKSSHELAQQIEQLVSAVIAAHRSVANAAVERAFARTTAPASRARPSSVGPRKIAPKRPPAEMATLTERLYAAVAAHPGEPMTALAPAVGVEAARPIALGVDVPGVRVEPVQERLAAPGEPTSGWRLAGTGVVGA